MSFGIRQLVYLSDVATGCQVNMHTSALQYTAVPLSDTCSRTPTAIVCDRIRASSCLLLKADTSMCHLQQSLTALLERLSSLSCIQQMGICLRHQGSGIRASCVEHGRMPDSWMWCSPRTCVVNLLAPMATRRHGNTQWC